MKILVIIPAYNEENNIYDTVTDLKKYCPDFDHIIVNDASTDRTESVAKTNHFNVVSLISNLGIGGAVQTGYMYAKENGYDIAVQMDGDGQHPAADLRHIVQPILDGEADMVVGSRYIEKEGFQSSGLRRTGIRFLSGLIFFCTGKRILDVTSGFRAVNKEIIDVFSREYAVDYPEPESLMVAINHGARISEIPVQMRQRQGGTSSITWIRSIYYMIKVSLAILLKKK